MTATSERELETKIQSKGLVKNRLTPEDIDALIDSTSYHVFADTTTTVCCIKLTNGFTVTGESACVDPANFDTEIGQEIAYNEARQKIWGFEGYLLNDKLARFNKIKDDMGFDCKQEEVAPEECGAKQADVILGSLHRIKDIIIELQEADKEDDLISVEVPPNIAKAIAEKMADAGVEQYYEHKGKNMLIVGLRNDGSIILDSSSES